MNIPPVDLTATTLDNGLTVLHIPSQNAPLAALNLNYMVGSRDEEAQKTGFAHLFEHLMFQGSKNVASGEHSKLVRAMGGSMNGTTSFDQTNYFETVPRHGAEMMFYLEGDRMESLLSAVDEAALANQRDVVKNERRQSYDNVPYGTMWENLMQRIFPVGHPYHHMPIGSMEDLDNASLTDVHDFFLRYYMPANAVLTVAGDVSAAQMEDWTAKYFGSIPGRVLPARKKVSYLGALQEDISVELTDTVPLPRSILAWRVPGAPTRINTALHVLMGVLSEGYTSRLTRRLVLDEEKSNSLFGTTLTLAGGEDVAVVSVMGAEDADTEYLAAAVREEISILASTPPSAQETLLAQTNLNRSILSDLSTVQSRADQVSSAYSCYKDPMLPFTLPGVISSITPEDVSAAAKLLTNPSVFISYKGASA